MSDRSHILVVDDEPQITRVLRTALTAQGYDIRVANDGEMALEIMKDWAPNLIITDLSMPHFDGIQLCRRVRAVSQVPIVVLSVRDQERQKEFDLLLYLSQHPHRVSPHRTLLAAIWGANSTEQPEYLRVFIGQLRKKVEPDPAEPRYLLTERWVGYRFEPGD